MGFKEIFTYVSAVIGLAIVCYARILYSKRQQTMPDNTYNKEEKTILYIGYVIVAIAFILACIPVY